MWDLKGPLTRDRTLVLCIGKWTLNHWATREVQNITNFKLKNFIENLGAVLLTVDYMVVNLILARRPRSNVKML